MAFYQFQQFVEYKAKLAGVTVTYVDPAYTSKTDSRSGLIGKRNGFDFIRADCKREHSGVNAAFNIALSQPLPDRKLDAQSKSLRSHKKYTVGDASPLLGQAAGHSIEHRQRCVQGAELQVLNELCHE